MDKILHDIIDTCLRLHEYQRKQIAIILLASTLGDLSRVDTAELILKLKSSIEGITNG